MRVENMQSRRGNFVPNQFIIYTDEGTYFQSYHTVIAFRPLSGNIQLDQEKYDYSRTTMKYRNLFLRMDSKEIERKIKSGDIILADLNK